MSKQEEIYAFWTENTGLTREVAIQQVIKKFEVAYETARTYYPKWRKEFLKPKLSAVGQPQQIIEKEYKKPMETEKKEFSEYIDDDGDKVIGTIPPLDEKIFKKMPFATDENGNYIVVEAGLKNKAIAEENIKSEATTLKEEKAEVNEPVEIAEPIVKKRLSITKILKVKGNFIEFDNVTEDIKIKANLLTAILSKSSLDDLIDELVELREVLKEGENHN